MRDGFDIKEDGLRQILKEADEISRILAAAIIKLKKIKAANQSNEKSEIN